MRARRTIPLLLLPLVLALGAPSAAHASPADARTALASIAARADAMDHAKRGRFAVFAPLLRPIARDSLPVLLDAIAHPEKWPQPRSESARIALRAQMIEAAGATRSAAGAPLWRSILASDSNEWFENRAAAEALGKIGDGAAVATLSAMARARGPKQRAAIAGLGACRRVEAIDALGDAIDGADATTAKTIADSLGRAASSWANTPPEVRARAARHALRVFVLFDADVRAMASDALMQIDSSDTPALVSTARAGAAPDLAAALDDLAARFARNPVR